MDPFDFEFYYKLQFPWIQCKNQVFFNYKSPKNLDSDFLSKIKGLVRVAGSTNSLLPRDHLPTIPSSEGSSDKLAPNRFA